MLLLHIPKDSKLADLYILSPEKIAHHPVAGLAVIPVVDHTDLSHEILLPGIVRLLPVL